MSKFIQKLCKLLFYVFKKKKNFYRQWNIYTFKKEEFYSGNYIHFILLRG